MKLTWTDQLNLAQEISGLNDTASLVRFKRDINTGSALFMSQLNREYNRKSRFTDLVAGQQYYQFPEDAFMLKEVIVSTGSWFPPMEQIPDEFAWRMMNMLKITGIPTHFFIRGRNEMGLYPTPSQSITSGIELVFAPRGITMTEVDTTSVAGTTNATVVTPTVNVSNGTNTITANTGTPFTPRMKGQWFSVTDGSDYNWYQIQDYTSSSVLVLENDYQGLTSTGINWRIGQVMDLPEEYLEAPVDYAMYRFYLKRGIVGLTQANEFQSLFTTALQGAKDTYGQVSESQVISAEPRFRIYNPWRGDSPPSISA